MTGNLQTAEYRSFYSPALTHLTGVNDIQTALPAYQQFPVWCITDRTLIVGTVLQAVTVVIAAHYEVVRSVPLFLRHHIGHTVVGHQPHGVPFVFYDTVYRRAEQTRLHIYQIHLFCFRIPDRCTRCRALPSQSSAILHRIDRHFRDTYTVLIICNIPVDNLTRLRVNQRVKQRVRHHHPPLLRATDRRDIIAGDSRIFGTDWYTHLTGSGIQALHTTSQGSQPNVAPLVFIDGPDIIVSQIAHFTCHPIVGHMSVLDMDESTLVSTEPHRTVTRCQGAYHGIRTDAMTCLVVDDFLFRLGIKTDYTCIIGTQPVFTRLIYTDGIDIAQL